MHNAHLFFSALFWRYLGIIRFKISRVLIFRTEMAIWIVLSFLPFAILFLIWQELYAGQSEVHGYTLSDITAYYLVGIIITNLTDVHFEGWRSEEIRLGRIDHFLLKPYHYLVDVFLGETVGKSLYALMFTVPYAVFIAWSATTANLILPSITATAIGAFLLLLLSAYIMQCCVGMLITLLTFWFEGAQGLEQFKWLTITVLSGSLMPMEFLPSWLQSLTAALPFKYLYAVPINVLLGRSTVQTTDLAYSAATLTTLLFLVHIVWKRGIAKYASVGG